MNVCVTLTLIHTFVSTINTTVFSYLNLYTWIFNRS
uniref:Uncharacterized protein n=1 Tax=Rhizophora mucronata TaxID=61149 RepID=A0A2P2PG89_RHIMU